MDAQQQGEARTDGKVSRFVLSSNGDIDEWFCCAYCGCKARKLANTLNHTLRHFKKGVVCNEVLNDGSLCSKKCTSPETRNDHRVEVHGRFPPGYIYRPDKKKIRILRGPKDLASVTEFLADLERSNPDRLRILKLSPGLGYVLHFSPGMGLPYYRKEGLKMILLPTANFPSRTEKEKSLNISKVEDELLARGTEARLWATVDAAKRVSPESEFSSHKLVQSSHVVPDSRRPVSSVSAGPAGSSASFDDGFDIAVAVLSRDLPRGTSGSRSSVRRYHPYRALAPPKAPQSQSRGSSISLFGPFSPSFYGRALEDGTH